MGKPTVLFLQNIEQENMDAEDPGFSAGEHFLRLRGGHIQKFPFTAKLITENVPQGADSELLL